MGPLAILSIDKNTYKEVSLLLQNEPWKPKNLKPIFKNTGFS